MDTHRDTKALRQMKTATPQQTDHIYRLLQEAGLRTGKAYLDARTGKHLGMSMRERGSYRRVSDFVEDLDYFRASEIIKGLRPEDEADDKLRWGADPAGEVVPITVSLPAGLAARAAAAADLAQMPISEWIAESVRQSVSEGLPAF